jgi:hypothetical protein
MKPVHHVAVAAAIVAALLAGCEQRMQTTQTTPGATPSGLSAPPVQQADIAADLNSARDPSLPPAESATEPSTKKAQDPAVTQYSSSKENPAPAAETGTDSAHSATTASERDTEMPLKGQANDYSTPDRAKEADQPNTASKEPGGQEAHPGNGQTASSAPAS